MPEIFTPPNILKAEKRIKPWISSNFDRLALHKDETSIFFKNQLESWIKNIEKNKKRDLIGRLTSYSNTDNISAFFELMWHQFLVEEKYKVKIEPELENGRKPEFLVKTENQNLYFEVFSVVGNEDGELQKKINITEEVLGKINLMEGFYPIAIGLKDWIGPNVKYSNFINFIKKLAKEGSFDGELKNSNKILYDRGGLRAEIKIFPKRERSGKILMTVGYPGILSEVGSKKIKERIREKILKYRPIKTSGDPFVIAVCFDLTGSIYGHYNLEYDLFGLPVIKVPIASGKRDSQAGRDGSGIFFKKDSLGELKNTRLSAVISCTRVWKETEKYPQGFYAYKIEVFHNPFAKNPLDESVFNKFAQFVPRWGKISLEMKWKNKRENRFLVF